MVVEYDRIRKQASSCWNDLDKKTVYWKSEVCMLKVNDHLKKKYVEVGFLRWHLFGIFPVCHFECSIFYLKSTTSDEKPYFKTEKGRKKLQPSLFLILFIFWINTFDWNFFREPFKWHNPKDPGRPQKTCALFPLSIWQAGLSILRFVGVCALQCPKRTLRHLLRVFGEGAVQVPSCFAILKVLLPIKKVDPRRETTNRRSKCPFFVVFQWSWTLFIGSRIPKIRRLLGDWKLPFRSLDAALSTYK